MFNQLKFNKNRTIILLYLFIGSLLFAGCNNTTDIRYQNPKYGKTLNLNVNGAPDNIFPGQVLKQSEQIITTQVYDGLIKYNTRNLEISPSIAKKWLVEREGSIYTFFLNPEAKFHDDNCFPKGIGRNITAYDFKYSIEQICRSHIRSNHAISKQISNIKGFDAFLDSEKRNDTSEINGIFVYDDTTLVFKLNKADEMFIHFLAGTNSLVFAKEAFEAYGLENQVGSGAYLLKHNNNKREAVTLTANLNYFQKNQQGEQLPFIDTIRFSFISSNKQELLLFKNNKLNLLLSMSERLVTPFLDENIGSFQSNPPYYIMRQTLDYYQNVKYNILRSNLKDLYLNSQGFFDFSIVYFEEPKAQEIQIIN